MNHGRTGHLARFTLAQHLPRRSATTIKVAALVHAPEAAMLCERRAEIHPKNSRTALPRFAQALWHPLDKAVTRDTRLGDRSFLCTIVSVPVGLGVHLYYETAAGPRQTRRAAGGPHE